MTANHPSGPKPDALPGCATPRLAESLPIPAIEPLDDTAVRGKPWRNEAGIGSGSPGIVPNPPRGPSMNPAEMMGGGVRPRLLDLFCCAGGAAMGYYRAGFDVVGVDIKPQPRYPFEFIQADCLTLDRDFLASFDAIHASPPCQGYTDLRHAPGAVGAPRLIAAVREKLSQAGRPFVIENVDGAEVEMINPRRLCGSMFGLGSQGCQLQRHRWFEASFWLDHEDCQHSDAPVIGVYGGHARKRSARAGGRGTRDIWAGGHKAAASEAMGIDWMTLAEMSEAIPPAYTEFIGKRLIEHLQQRRAA